jgi:hypothetical protein
MWGYADGRVRYAKSAIGITPHPGRHQPQPATGQYEYITTKLNIFSEK